jgi:hypothetical protein
VALKSTIYESATLQSSWDLGAISFCQISLTGGKYEEKE